MLESLLFSWRTYKKADHHTLFVQKHSHNLIHRSNQLCHNMCISFSTFNPVSAAVIVAIVHLLLLLSVADDVSAQTDDLLWATGRPMLNGAHYMWQYVMTMLGYAPMHPAPLDPAATAKP